MSKHKKKRKHSKSGKNRTPLDKHAKIGKTLFPPFSKVEKMVLTSWMNNRLPDMLWAALIRSALDQEWALGQFRRIIEFIGEHPRKSELHDITLTGISKLDNSLQEELISFIIQEPLVARTLSTLRLFETLPARDIWDRLLPKHMASIELLMKAIGTTLIHQSQEATDCRWFRIMAIIVAGKLLFRKGEDENLIDELRGYPNIGDQRQVRPTIRAMEGTFESQDPANLVWPRAFWQEAWKRTPCLELKETGKSPVGEISVTRRNIREILSGVRAHWEATHETTAIDAKHDAVFGMTFFALRTLEELLGIGTGTSILGRLGLRSILEVHINLHYLLQMKDDELWKKWRTYGAGQAKLNALKFDNGLEVPKHITIETLEHIASEDIWEEFLPINLGSWSGLDLRRLSDSANLKETYDKHYSWTSGYVHGTWGAIREACYKTCGNPLHRLHRYPENNSLSDTVSEAAELVNLILDDMSQLYPNFTQRFPASRSSN